MAASIRAGIGRNAPPVHHIESVVEQPRYEIARCKGIVGVVAVDQHVDVRLDIREHAAHHVALTLLRFAPNDRSGRCGLRSGIVGRIIVVDVDDRARQRRAEIRDDARDRAGLVETRNQDRDGRVARQIIVYHSSSS